MFELYSCHTHAYLQNVLNYQSSCIKFSKSFRKWENLNLFFFLVYYINLSAEDSERELNILL